MEENRIKVRIDINKKIHTMKGGIGASWHSLSRDIPMENEKYEYPARMNAQPRGSALAGIHRLKIQQHGNNYLNMQSG